MCSSSLNIIEIDYSALFLYLWRQSISAKDVSEILHSKFGNPVKEVKIRQWFVYKIDPSIAIELNGLFFPSNSPAPLDFYFTPAPIGFFQLPKKGGGKYG